MKRFLAIVLSLVLVVALVGCGSKKRQPIKLTLSTEDSEAILAAAGITLPDVEVAAGAGTTVQWFAWYDPFHNYEEDEVVNTGYFTFTEKYHNEIEWIETDYFERNNDLANLLVAGTAPDFSPAGSSNTAVFPMSCVRGMYQPVDDYLDFTDPLWSGIAETAEYFSLGGHHFAIVTDSMFKDVVGYNRRVIDEWGFDDRYELYMNDEWTWDNFYDMCMDFSDADSDRYALDGWYVTNGICEESSGHYVIEKDNETGKFYSNIDDPIIEVAQNMIYDLVKNDCCYHSGSDYWANRNDAQYGAGIKDGLCLFYICDISGFRLPVDEMNQIWGDIGSGEFMFVPLPRYQDGDGIYYLNSTPSGYMLIAGARNPEGAVLLSMCDRFKIIDPTVISIDKKQLKETYLWSDELLDMYDLCYELAQANPRVFYTGDLPENLQNAYNSLDWGIRRNGGATTWAQLKEQNAESIAYYIDELNSMIDSYEYTGEFQG